MHDQLEHLESIWSNIFELFPSRGKRQDIVDPGPERNGCTLSLVSVSQEKTRNRELGVAPVSQRVRWSFWTARLRLPLGFVTESCPRLGENKTFMVTGNQALSLRVWIKRR